MRQKDGKHSNSEDAALFRDAVGDVEPINSTRRHQPAGSHKPGKAVFRRRDERNALRETLVQDPEAEDVETGAELSFRRTNVPATRLRQLRQGKIAIQEEIDLHGLRSNEARAALREFISYSIGKGFKCVRVVHGKGLGSGPSGPVLKHGVNNWLRNWDEVLAFSSAPARFGGTGAVYVLLRSR